MNVTKLQAKLIDCKLQTATSGSRTQATGVKISPQKVFLCPRNFLMTIIVLISFSTRYGPLSLSLDIRGACNVDIRLKVGQISKVLNFPLLFLR